MAEEIKVKLTLDSNLKRQMEQAARDVKRGTGKIEKSASGAMGAVKGLAIGFVSLKTAIAAGRFMWDAAKAAGNLNEALSKQATVFKGLGREVANMNSVLTKSYGLSRREAASFTSTIQDTLVPLGVARDKAADMSFEVVKLSRDLASFNNVPTEEVIRGVQSALVGNVETLRRYGVALNQDIIVQKALNDGLIKTKSELTPTTKAMAILRLTMEGSGDAMGDFARTSESFNNKLATLGSTWEDFQAAMGQFVSNSPITVRAINEISQALQNMSNWLNKSKVDELDKSIAAKTKESNTIATRLIVESSKDHEGMMAVFVTKLKERGERLQSDIKILREEREKILNATSGASTGSAGSGSAPAGGSSGLPKAKKPDSLIGSGLVSEQGKSDLEFMISQTQYYANVEEDMHKRRRERAKEREADDQKEIDMARRKNEIKMQMAGNAAGILKNLASINKNASRENFQVYQAAAISEAIITTAGNVLKAYGTPPAPNFVAAGLAGALGAAQIAAISAEKPRFAQGGIVPGNMLAGDQITARVNSGEMILNRQQQGQLFGAISRGSMGGSNIRVGGDTIIINGNADENAIAAIAQTREDQLQEMREMLIELQAAGQMPSAA